jgi:hypothetical protein
MRRSVANFYLSTLLYATVAIATLLWANLHQSKSQIVKVYGWPLNAYQGTYELSDEDFQAFLKSGNYTVTNTSEVHFMDCFNPLNALIDLLVGIAICTVFVITLARFESVLRRRFSSSQSISISIATVAAQETVKQIDSENTGD